MIRKDLKSFLDTFSTSDILSSRDRRKLVVVIAIQICLSILDLIGVALIGVLGALTINGVRSKEPTGRIGWLLDFLHINEFSFQKQTVILALIAVILLVSRTLISVVITRKTLFFLSNRSAEISSRLIRQVMAQPLTTLHHYSSQFIHYTLSTGASSLTLGVLGNTVAVITDLALLIVLGVGILVLDPLTAILTVSIFGSLMLFMYRLTNSRTQLISTKHAELTIKDSESLLELLDGYREAFIRNRRGFFVDNATKIKWQIADFSAELAWMPNISKYVVEIAFTVGTMAVAGLQFVANDSAHAVGSLALFLAAGTRITPALLRVQQNLVTINGSLSRAQPTLDLFRTINLDLKLPDYRQDIDVLHQGFKPILKVRDLNFRYPETDSHVLTDISFNINAGDTVAIVGPSGAGKSTLIDLILGIYLPTSGDIKISDLPPIDAIKKWPGALGYVPQEIVLRNGSISSNVASGFEESDLTRKLSMEALEIAQLSAFIQASPGGLDTQVGERGGMLSGGQKQRVGIARAMFTKPQLLVLDEATSSLDGQTEAEISEAIQNLKGRVTLIVIAHRLSTVKHADLIIYLDNGRIMAQGSFEEVRALVPDFDKQAQLLGL